MSNDRLKPLECHSLAADPPERKTYSGAFKSIAQGLAERDWQFYHGLRTNARKTEHVRAMMSQLRDFLNFEHYLTPSLFRIFYLLPLAMMIGSFLFGFIWLVGTLVGAVAAAIAARIFTEIIMVLFQNNEHLAVIRARTEGR